MRAATSSAAASGQCTVRRGKDVLCVYNVCVFVGVSVCACVSVWVGVGGGRIGLCMSRHTDKFVFM